MKLAHVVAWLAVTAVAAACRTGNEGTLRAEWTSVDTALGGGRLKLPLGGRWCGTRGRLTLLGFSGDTGVGMVVRTVKLAPGLFIASDTAAQRSPGSTIAFRLANRSSLFTLSSDSGAVAITSMGNGELAGRFVGWFSRGGRPVVLTGRFSRVTVLPDSVRCESDAPPAALPALPADSGVS